MSKIEAIIGGKAVGLADQASIEPAFGCKNRCVGCYGKKSSQRGEGYDNVLSKEFDKEHLVKSIKRVKAKGIEVARVGKHCDPGNHIDNLNGILDCCNNESFGCVVVSKSIIFNIPTAELLKKGNHILHVSLGPHTDKAPAEEDRIREAVKFEKWGCKVVIRLTRDITQWITPLDKKALRLFECIVTPMRYPSKDIAAFYRADLDNFLFKNGYYRPQIVHESWKEYMQNVCGEVRDKIYCCNCLTGIGE